MCKKPKIPKIKVIGLWTSLHLVMALTVNASKNTFFSIFSSVNPSSRRYEYFFFNVFLASFRMYYPIIPLTKTDSIKNKAVQGSIPLK